MYLMQNCDPTEIVNPDDIRIRRIYTRTKGQLAPDSVVARVVDVEVVVEWEAGSAANRYYGPAEPNVLELEVLAHSLNNCALGGLCVAIGAGVPGSPATPLKTDGMNREGTYQTEFTLPGPLGPWFPAAPNDVYEFTAILRGPVQAGAIPFQVAFAKCLCYVY